MKLLLFFCFLSLTYAAAAKNGTLKIGWSFSGFHEQRRVKLVVRSDDAIAGESAPVKMSESGCFEVDLSQGSHRIEAKIFVLNEAEWKPFSLSENEWLDAEYTGTIDIAKLTSLNLDFDHEERFAIASLSGAGKTKKTGDQIAVEASWQFVNTVEGFDHPSRVQVFVDGDLVQTSGIKQQTERNDVSFSVRKGSHTIRLETQAYYNNVWDVHTKENDYSVDAVYEAVIDFQRPLAIRMIFDVGEERSYIRAD
jgi:hypothetical protein